MPRRADADIGEPTPAPWTPAAFASAMRARSAPSPRTRWQTPRGRMRPSLWPMKTVHGAMLAGNGPPVSASACRRASSPTTPSTTSSERGHLEQGERLAEIGDPDHRGERGADARPDGIGHRQIEPLQRQDHRRRRQHIEHRHGDRRDSSAKPRDSFIAVMPATSSRMAAERKIQGIGQGTASRKACELRARSRACRTQQRNCMTP